MWLSLTQHGLEGCIPVSWLLKLNTAPGSAKLGLAARSQLAGPQLEHEAPEQHHAAQL